MHDTVHFPIMDWEGYMDMPESGFIRRASVVRRVDALFRAMSSDYLLREQFITNPSQVLTEYVHGHRLDADQASICNQLIYAFASNHSLRKWLHAYAFEHRDRIPSGERFVHDFAHAVAWHKGAHVVMALIRSTARADSLSFFDNNLLHYVLNLPVAHGLGLGSDGTGDTGTGTGTNTGTDTATGTGTGTGTDTATGTGTGTGTGTEPATTTGTGTGTGTDTATATGTGTGTGTDTATATGTGTGTGTNTATGTGTGTGGTLTAVTWSTYITGTGTGTGTSTGTAITMTGTGFTRSPFTGTDHVTDNRTTGFNDFGPAYVMVTLDALAQFATQLAAAGALEFSLTE